MKVKHGVKLRRLQGELWLPSVSVEPDFSLAYSDFPFHCLVYHSQRKQEGKGRSCEWSSVQEVIVIKSQASEAGEETLNTPAGFLAGEPAAVSSPSSPSLRAEPPPPPPPPPPFSSPSHHLPVLISGKRLSCHTGRFMDQEEEPLFQRSFSSCFLLPLESFHKVPYQK